MDSVSQALLREWRIVTMTDSQRNAASTYNLLFEEGRTISAALCPLKAIDRSQ
jgi:uncharacterized protein